MEVNLVLDLIIPIVGLLFAIVVGYFIGKHMVEKLAGKENDINRCKLLTMSANILAEVK